MCAAATFENRALYVHIPFCQGICAYCDFTRVRYQTGLADQYLTQLARELEERVPCKGMETVYIGGGTPTALSLDQLRRLLDLLQPYLQGATEVTIEANPEAISTELIEILVKGGINRISLGLQSCDDEILKQIGRRPYVRSGASGSAAASAGRLDEYFLRFDLQPSSSDEDTMEKNTPGRPVAEHSALLAVCADD